jgi:L-asparaginase
VIEDLVAFAPVVLASRVEAGRTLESTYGFPGGEIDLLSRGLLAAGGLGALKARILLSTLLSSGASREAVERSFRCCVQRYDGSGAVDVHR